MKTTKSEIAYEYIKDKIMSNIIKPNEFIDLDLISSELNMSKTPIREAIKLLEANGLVETNPNVGAVVKQLNLDELEQIAIIRRELESLATELATQNMDKDTIAELKKYIDEMEKHCNANNPHDYTLVNQKFHLTIYEKCNLPILYNMIKELWEKSERTKWVFTLFPERLQHSNVEHKKLIKAFEDNDKDTARTLMYDQKSKGFLSVLKVLKEVEKLRI